MYTVDRKPFYKALRLPRVLLSAAAVMVALSAVSVRFIPMITEVRSLIVLTLILALFTGVYFLARLITRRRIVLLPVVIFLAAVVVWVAFADRPVDVESLRSEYQRQLSGFMDAPYVWGGEANWGVDCSGLARTALWRAMLMQGLRTANPRLLGPMLWSFWWNDISASGLDEGRFGYTRTIGSAKKLAGHDTSALKVGDIAVAARTHVLVYYGDGQWIEASPKDWLVVANKAPADSKRGYFNMSVKLVRWRVLDDGVVSGR